MRPFVRKQSGFSVVEMMVSIGIVAIMSTIAVPTFQRYKRKAVENEIQTNIGALSKGVKAYYYAEHQLGRGADAEVVSNCSTKTTHGHWMDDPEGTKTVNEQGAHMAMTGMRPSWPPDGEAHEYDWASDPQFVALGFNPSNAVYAHYFVHGGSAHDDDLNTGIAGGRCGLMDQGVSMVVVWWNLNEDPSEAGDSALASFLNWLGAQRGGEENVKYSASDGQLYRSSHRRVEER